MDIAENPAVQSTMVASENCLISNTTRRSADSVSMPKPSNGALTVANEGSELRHAEDIPVARAEDYGSPGRAERS